jgi:hypothetical protein
MKNYKRFYMRKSFLSYPWIRDKFKRRYMLGCLKAFYKSTVERRFYDLGRIGYKGGQKNVDFKFDPSKILTADELVQLRPKGKKAGEPKATSASVMACGGSPTADVHRHLRTEDSNEPIDAFFDPRGFAKQRTQQKLKGAEGAPAEGAASDPSDVPPTVN